MPTLDMMLLIGAAAILVGAVAARIGSRTGMPALLLFLLVGIVIGKGFDIQFADAALAHDLGFAALVMILAEGGLTTKWSEVKRYVSLAGLLATVGIAVSIALMSLFGYYVLGLPRAVAVLLGAITAPTDSAAVFAVLRGLPLPARVRASLEGESGLNDAPVVLLVAAGSQYALGVLPEGGVAGLFGMVIGELAGGMLLGAVLGFIGVWLLRRIALPASGLYPIAALSWAVATYGLGVLSHLSGFAAVYVCAVILGNGSLPHRHAIRSFAEGVGWVSQIGLFMMLGLLSANQSVSRTDIIFGILAGLFLTFIARPVSVIASVGAYRGMGHLAPREPRKRLTRLVAAGLRPGLVRVPWKEQAFLSWAGLRGAVPIILATVPLADRINDSDLLFNLVLVFVVVFTAVQAPTLGWAARKLGLIDPLAAHDIDVEAAPLEERRADLLQITIPAGSHLAGVTVRELRLPPNVIIALIMHGSESYSPDGHSLLRAGDELLIVTPAALRAEVESRMTAIGRFGRLAQWKGSED